MVYILLLTIAHRKDENPLKTIRELFKLIRTGSQVANLEALVTEHEEFATKFARLATVPEHKICSVEHQRIRIFAHDDVTRRKRAQAEAQELAEQLRQLSRRLVLHHLLGASVAGPIRYWEVADDRSGLPRFSGLEVNRYSGSMLSGSGGKTSTR